jgi:hypothetical protein
MRKSSVFTPLMALLTVGTASAQDISSSALVGRVMSQDGTPLQGVRVVIESTALLGQRQALTDASGQFRVSLLPGGSYTVTYTFTDYRTRRLNLTLVAGQVGNGNVRLSKVEAQEVVVEILGTEAQVDKTDTVTQTSFTADRLEMLANIDVGGLNALTPGVAGNVTGTYNIRGGTSRSTKTLFNGINITESYGGYAYMVPTPMTDMIESIAIITSPLNARYGNTDGGLISYVTSKGSNEWKGTFRAYANRGFWNTRDAGYPYRDGREVSSVAPDEWLDRSYEFSLQGPIWKDRLTFAYGGSIQPQSYWSRLWSGTTGGGSRWTPPPTGPQPTDRVGTYYQASNGDVIRRSELRAFSEWDSMMYGYSKDVNNQFTLFAQITPGHQLEYYYNETSYFYTPFPNLYMGEALTDYYENDFTRLWSIAYKGIIGSMGVLDIRTGKSTLGWLNNSGGRKSVSIYQIPSLIPKDGNYDNLNPSNYVANGFVDAIYLNPTSGQRDYLFNGSDQDLGDGGSTTSTALNYQHFLNAKGMHTIDVGYQNDTTNWNLKASGAPYFFSIPGQIATDLRDSDVKNPYGNPQLASQYAGMYIVFNVHEARVRDVDPYAASLHPDIANRPLLPVSTDINNYFYPRLRERYGVENGEINSTMQSFYINDLWTVNDNHSVMLGVRFDNYKLGDGTRSNMHSYSVPTFRFEYKFDMNGDQSRLFGVSMGQFHTAMATSVFSGFVEGRLSNTRTRYWNKGSAQPYLVNLSDILDPDNYGPAVTDSVAGPEGTRIDPDFKAPTSTEYTLWYRKAFASGGNVKFTVVFKTFDNMYDFLPGETYERRDKNGNFISNNIRFLLGNVEGLGYERSYSGAEVEWDIPFTRRVTFGGNYTFARLMHNQTTTGSAEAMIRNASATFAMPLYWESVYGDRESWNPTMLSGNEHTFKFYFLYDLSSGKTKSNITFRGQYNSYGIGRDLVNMYYGYPTFQGVIDYPGGGSNNPTQGLYANAANLTQGYAITTNTYANSDNWSMTLRYNLTVPLAKGLSWFTTIDIDNPFNHRAYMGNFATNSLTNSLANVVYPVERPINNGSPLPINDPYNGDYRWRAEADVNGWYRNRMNGRAIRLQTGLRF